MTGAATRAWAWLRRRTGTGLLMALWAAAAIPLTLDSAQVVRASITTQLLGAPTDAVIVHLQEERRLSAGYLAGVLDRDALVPQRERTDQAYRRLQDAVTGRPRMALGSKPLQRADELLRHRDELTRLRLTTDNGTADPATVQSRYTQLVAAAFAGAPWLSADRADGSALLLVGRARETLSQQDAVLLAASGSAALDGAARARIAQLVWTRRVLLTEAAGGLPQSARSGYQALAAEPATQRLTAWEDTLLATPNGYRTAGQDWPAALDGYGDRLRAFEVSAVGAAGHAAASGAVVTVVGAGLLEGLALAWVFVMLRRAVRGSAATSARPSPATPAATGGEPAGTSARLLELLLHQNKRSQALMHRLLRQLDAAQRRVVDDATLGELFRIDHLASRVRRNIEKTIALTGGLPGRRWTRPVPLVDVVRAAAAEVAGFERVSTARVEPAELAGAVVTDLMHLLAELIENAAAFSAAETRVRVTGRHVSDGYLLTVTDHGPGMTQDDLRLAAEVLASTVPPATDAWDGLYAAGRLAARAGVTVQLHNGADAGLSAEIGLPAALLTANAQATAELPAVSPGPPDRGAGRGLLGATLAGVTGDE